MTENSPPEGLDTIIQLLSNKPENYLRNTVINGNRASVILHAARPYISYKNITVTGNEAYYKGSFYYAENEAYPKFYGMVVEDNLC